MGCALRCTSKRNKVVFGNWWKEFWVAKGAGDINYKTAFHKGVGDLIKFEVSPTA
jgi:hypothetical protein